MLGNMSNPVKKVPIHLQSSQNRLLIKNGKVVTEDDVFDEDVYIEDGIIKQMGRNLIIPGGTRIIDAQGHYLLPGGIDPHTHFDFEFMGSRTVDDFYTGTKAAIAGGTTMIIDFVFPKEGESLLDAFWEYRRKADGKACCDYALHVCLPSWSARVQGDMETLCKEHGVNSFKMFMAYDFRLDDGELYSAFDHCRKLGAIAQVHAENGAIIAKNAERLLAQGITGPEGHELSRPEEVEAEAVNRACVIAKQVDCPLYVVHVMSKSAAEKVREGRANGGRVYGETLAAALGTDGCHDKHECFQHSAGHILSPPLRPDPTTPGCLMNYLAQDVLQLTGSDHCTFTKAQKELGLADFTKIPNGVNGVEERMSVLWEKGVHAGVLTPSRFVAVTSANAAKLFNLYPRKGCIAVGSDADIVVWNAGVARTISAGTHHQAGDFNVFEGMQCHGVPEYVIVSGRVCLDEGQLRVAEGHGHYIETPVFAPYVYEPTKIGELKPSRNGPVAPLEPLDLSELDGDYRLLKTQHDYVLSSTHQPDSMLYTPTGKGARPEGQRNIQESTFSLSEELDTDRKSSIRVQNPPGGKSSGFW